MSSILRLPTEKLNRIRLNIQYDQIILTICVLCFQSFLRYNYVTLTLATSAIVTTAVAFTMTLLFLFRPEKCTHMVYII